MTSNKAKSIVALVVALVVIGVVVGYVFPVAMSALNNTTEQTESLTETVETDVVSDSTIYLESGDVNQTATPSTINFTFNDTRNDDSYRKTKLVVGVTVTLETKSGDIDVTLDSVDSSTECTVTFEYEDSFGWTSAERALNSLFGLMIILVLVISIIGLLLMQLRKSM